jgi:hypothetical protein
MPSRRRKFVQNHGCDRKHYAPSKYSCLVQSTLQEEFQSQQHEQANCQKEVGKLERGYETQKKDDLKTLCRPWLTASGVC